MYRMSKLEIAILDAINADPELVRDKLLQSHVEQVVKSLALLYTAMAREGAVFELCDVKAWVGAVVRAHLSTYRW